jgi:hypothetical protein
VGEGDKIGNNLHFAYITFLNQRVTLPEREILVVKGAKWKM